MGYVFLQTEQTRIEIFEIVNTFRIEWTLNMSISVERKYKFLLRILNK